MHIADLGYLLSKCKIDPILQDGVITAISQSCRGTEIQVDYFMNGEHRTEWFPEVYIALVEAAEPKLPPAEELPWI